MTKLSEEKHRQILHHVQTITSLAQLITIEYQNSLVDTRFKIPIVNNKARRIISDAKDIIKAFNNIVKAKDEDFLEYDHAIQMHRVFKYFSVMDVKQVEQFMDLLEKEVPTIKGAVEYIGKEVDA